MIRQFENTQFPKKANLDLLNDPAELALVKMLVTGLKLVESAANAHGPHRIAFTCDSCEQFSFTVECG